MGPGTFPVGISRSRDKKQKKQKSSKRVSLMGGPHWASDEPYWGIRECQN